MNLAATIILAGGPGSGCQGPNCGRPAIEFPGKKNIFYHGTSARNAARIRKQGLQVGQSGNYKWKTSKYVSLTTDYLQADHFGAKAARKSNDPQGWVVFKLQIPEKMHSNFEKDGRVNDSWKSKESIPATHIKSMEQRKWIKWS